MLVLTRKTGQRLHIGEDIIVTVLEVSGERVKVGIEAPTTMHVLRDEVREQMVAENQRASAGKSQLRLLLGGLAPEPQP